MPAIRTDTKGGECKPETVNKLGRIQNKVVARIRTLPKILNPIKCLFWI